MREPGEMAVKKVIGVCALCLAVWAVGGGGVRAQNALDSGLGGEKIQEIMSACITAVQEGKTFGPGDPFQSCLVEKNVHAVAAPYIDTGIMRYAPAAGTEEQSTARSRAAETIKPFAQGQGQQNATEDEAFTTPRYYIQSGKSGGGAKPLFLHR